MAGETFVRRYGGGWVDNTGQVFDAQAGNAYDAALMRLLGEDPAQDEVGVWIPGSGHFVFQKITNAQIDAAAAIDKSKLGPLAIVDSDIAGGAAIAASKLAGGIPASKISAGSAGQVLTTTDGVTTVWGAAGAQFKKTSSKLVKGDIDGVTETDLFAGSFTVSAGLLGTTGIARISAVGDYLQNIGGTSAAFRFKLKLGGTTILDSGTCGATAMAAAATRGLWEIEATIRNLGTANSQWVRLKGRLVNPSGWNVVAGAAPTTGAGAYWSGGGASHAFLDMALSSAIDTSASKLLELTVILPSTNASCEIKLYEAAVEIL